MLEYTNTHHLSGEHPDVDLMMYTAIRLEDEVSSSLHELFRTVAQEKITQQHLQRRLRGSISPKYPLEDWC